MATLPVYDRTGAEVDQYEIDPAELAPRVSKQLLHDAVVMYRTNRRQGSAKTKNRSEVTGTTKKMYRQKGTGNARAGSRRSNIRRGGGRAFAKRPRDWSYRLPRKALRAATRMAMASRIADNEVTLINELKFEEPKTSQMASILSALAGAGQMACLTEGLLRKKTEARKRAGARREAAEKEKEAGKKGAAAKKREGEPKQPSEVRVSIHEALSVYPNALLVAVADYDVNVYKSIRNLPGVSVLPVGQLNALEVLRPRRLLMTTAALDAFRQKPAAGGPAESAEPALRGGEPEPGNSEQPETDAAEG
jgi:large subunit ribosomal protein L4